VENLISSSQHVVTQNLEFLSILSPVHIVGQAGLRRSNCD
jgi:hypothetical protein